MNSFIKLDFKSFHYIITRAYTVTSSLLPQGGSSDLKSFRPAVVATKLRYTYNLNFVIFKNNKSNRNKSGAKTELVNFVSKLQFYPQSVQRDFFSKSPFSFFFALKTSLISVEDKKTQSKYYYSLKWNPLLFS